MPIRNRTHYVLQMRTVYVFLTDTEYFIAKLIKDCQAIAFSIFESIIKDQYLVSYIDGAD